MPCSELTLTLLGDVMLARLIDQLLPNHVSSTKDSENATRIKSAHPSLQNYTPSSPWGTTLPLLKETDLLLINLETPATTTTTPWPNKKYNYRTHPANLSVLETAHVDYTNLANNHVLDYTEEGLLETVWSLKNARIPFGGAGETTDEAYKPVRLWLPREKQEYSYRSAGGPVQAIPCSWAGREGMGGFAVDVYSFADHPREWGSVPTFHFIDYEDGTRVKLRRLLGSTRSSSGKDGGTGSGAGDGAGAEMGSALKIVSVHWGPNYSWFPSEKIRALAHFLVDECGVDIIHGHSSHHLQGVEVYKGSVIMYGCGDFVDDYVLRERFRNDLGAVWKVIVREVGDDEDGKRLVLDRLEIFPTRIELFQACRLDVGDADHGWVRRKITELSGELGTEVRSELGLDGQIIIDI